jgi:hypothetical protein
MSRRSELDEGVVVNVGGIGQFRPSAGRGGYRVLAAVVALVIGAVVTLAGNPFRSGYEQWCQLSGNAKALVCKREAEQRFS